MEGEWTLMHELTQGMELTKQLRLHLNSSTSSAETREFLVQRIQSSFDKALLILKWSGPAVAQPQPESPVSFYASPWNEDQKHVSKKRKILPKRTDHVTVCSENGLEGSMEDGYSWRKYGQKDILGMKYPRSYYRCTYRHIQGCWATKLVQRSDEDPSIIEVTYKGSHTCSQASRQILPPASPEKKQQPNLSVDTEDLGSKDMMSFPFSFPLASFAYDENESQFCTQPMVDFRDCTGSYSPSFISPATSEIFSANTSATNSPILDLDFSTDAADFCSFPFDGPGFFSSRIQ
uniref:WRKY transcription factor 47 n=1 Tax=Santalum album TaxID=35974 RepID=A0A650C2X8_SANAL|nr:WRKY transcription factor 47 [Santalum album]